MTAPDRAAGEAAVTGYAGTTPATSDEALRELAHEAVVYSWPLHEMSRMRAGTSPKVCAEAGRAGGDDADAPGPLRWCNLFVHARRLLGAGRSRVVTPNNDTLYSNAWLDLGDGPLVIDVPDTAGRYYVLGLLDFYGNPFASLGQRTTGTQARSFLVTGPGWQGPPPAGFEAPGAQVAAPTRWVWLIGRILVDGPADLPAVHAVQDGLGLRPLADWQAGRPGSRPKRFDPACDAQAPPGDADRYAAVVGRALADNPPPAGERATLERFRAVGIGPAAAPPDERQRAVLAQAIEAVAAQLRAAEIGPEVDGWQTMPLLGSSFGGDFHRRAVVAMKYIGALESREAIYPMAWRDARGEPLTGSRAYELRFAPGRLPPVDAFWSLTIYGSHDYLLVANPIDRYAVGDRTPGLRRDADGGLTIHVSHEPTDTDAGRANWLPAPAGGFYLCLRAYLPREEFLDGRYRLPPLRRVELRDGDA